MHRPGQKCALDPSLRQVPVRQFGENNGEGGE